MADARPTPRQHFGRRPIILHGPRRPYEQHKAARGIVLRWDIAWDTQPVERFWD
ncbi:MAG: hypothetical protein OXK78_09725 [Caldilineaceae bacterium]|nr:hypothetical protein [Caldilineaceae bacterium]